VLASATSNSTALTRVHTLPFLSQVPVSSVAGIGGGILKAYDRRRNKNQEDGRGDARLRDERRDYEGELN
jgi:hypothetical protein